jgi:signal transduction histidine kinase
VLRTTIERLRGTVRDLRALLVELHPPHLAAAGLAAAIGDIVSPLQERGVAVSVAIDGAERLDREQEALVYRVTQEAVRNVIAYAEADTLLVEMTVDEDAARLVVADDGRGFDPALRAQRLAEGHLGLSLVEELARQSGGELTISSSEGAGTRIELVVPSR